MMLYYEFARYTRLKYIYKRIEYQKHKKKKLELSLFIDALKCISNALIDTVNLIFLAKFKIDSLVDNQEII